MESNKFYKDGINFECQRCGNCCTCEGFVFLFKEDLDRLVNDAKIPLKDLKLRYLSTFREYTVLKDKANGECIFWDAEINGCKIYKHRPTQCTTYPFWNGLLKIKETFDKEKETCHGIGKGWRYTEEEIDELRKKY